METLIVCRHAESECSLRGIVNGEPNSRCPLTERGDEEARVLARALTGRTIDLCVTSEFQRVRQTARLALAGHDDVPWLELPELNDIRVGMFEGGALDLYREWAHAHGPGEIPPGGGESRAEAAARFVRGWRIVLARFEPTILAVTHGLVVSFLCEVVAGVTPRPGHDRVPYARPFEFDAKTVTSAVELLSSWAVSPHWGTPD